MANNFNSEVSKRLLELLKSSVSDGVPNQVSNVIAPVIDVSPKYSIRNKTWTLSDGTSGTAFTTSSTKRTFIIGGSLTVSKDANATSIYSDISYTQTDGSAANLILMRYEPLTAGSRDMVTMLPQPVEVKKGTAIAMHHSAGIASIDGTGIIFYYEVEKY